ncbi:MAG TPA: nitrous oxide reductase accessory protein NosL [Thermomicrobiales bacterium]
MTSLLLTGCRKRASANDPPKISYGKDVCARCRMIISEERHAGGLVDKDGEASLFDDTGELIAQVQEEGLGERRVWVHDYESREWIDGTTAFYVVDDFMTPMGTGVVAVAERDAADRLANEQGGRVMTWQEMLEHWRIARTMG